MDFSFSEEQSMLRDTVASFLADRYDFETRRKITKSEAGWRPDYWKAFADELGILGASFPEALGGLGGGPVETMIVMEAFGRALVVEPYLETVVIGGGFLQRSNHPMAADLIGRIVAGDLVIAFAYAEPQGRYNWADVTTTARRNGAGYVLNGHKAVVDAAPWADRLVVTARTAGGQRERQGVSVFLLDRTAAGVTTRDYPTIDGRRASEVYLENVAVPADALLGHLDQGLPLIERVIDEATAAAIAEATGVLAKLHEGTLEYTKQRKQFGQPIGSFQVLQHRMVDMFIAAEQATSISYLASLKLGEDDRERATAVSAAKAHVGKALRFVGQSAIQLHGGMGMTDEMAIGHYFKRGTVLESLFGSSDHHLARYEALSFT
ncbi:MAG TPA: acyl-CoA dehydrogenase family protein [Caulobacteraceae bacterium]|nr:acyl-CoA dehydrogenase family protein [Caulobacteraceae bacterium]